MLYLYGGIFGTPRYRSYSLPVCSVSCRNQAHISRHISDILSVGAEQNAKCFDTVFIAHVLTIESII